MKYYTTPGKRAGYAQHWGDADKRDVERKKPALKSICCIIPLLGRSRTTHAGTSQWRQGSDDGDTR